MANGTFKTSGQFQSATIVVFQTSAETDVRYLQLAVTPRHPTGKALVEQIIEDNSAALEALAKETRKVRKR